jgi:hypothetical protein
MRSPWAMDLELHRTGGTQFHEFVPKELEIRVWSEHFVLALAKISLSVTYLGNAFAGDCRYMRIWRKGNNGRNCPRGRASNGFGPLKMLES